MDEGVVGRVVEVAEGVSKPACVSVGVGACLAPAYIITRSKREVKTAITFSLSVWPVVDKGDTRGGAAVSV